MKANKLPIATKQMFIDSLRLQIATNGGKLQFVVLKMLFGD